MRSTTVSCLGLALGWLLGSVGARADSPRADSPSDVPAQQSAVSSQGSGIIVRLGLPEALPDPEPRVSASAATTLGSPCLIGGQHRVIRGQSPADIPPPPAPPPPPPPPPGAPSGIPLVAPPVNKEELYNCGVVTRSTSKFGGFFDKCWDNTKGFVQGVPGAITGIFQPDAGRTLFQTDHRFDAFAFPVSFPLYAEVPQATTEARFLSMYQETLHANPIFSGGDNLFVGGQFRLAVTDWLTLVVNRVGGVWMEPHNPIKAPGFAPHVGFSELWLGPQFTIVKNENSGTLFAAGLTFQVPTGPAKVFQDTGDLSLAPYGSFAQRLFPDFKWGSFIFWNTTGYNFRTDNVRSEYVYTVFHVNWDAGGIHRIYPEVGLKANFYTRDGNRVLTQGIGFEGDEWFNFGSNNSGRNDLSISTGLRLIINKHLQTGFAFQFGLLNSPHHMEAWGATVDLRIIY